MPYSSDPFGTERKAPAGQNPNREIAVWYQQFLWAINDRRFKGLLRVLWQQHYGSDTWPLIAAELPTVGALSWTSERTEATILGIARFYPSLEMLMVLDLPPGFPVLTSGVGSHLGGAFAASLKARLEEIRRETENLHKFNS